MQSKLALVLIAIFCLSVNTQAQNTITLETTTLTKREVVTGLTIPWEILWGPDDHIWATQRNGMVVRIEPASGNYTEILDWRFKTLNEDDNGGGSEYGMLGMAFHPDFETEKKIFLVYNFQIPFNSATQSSVAERLVSFEWDGTNLVNEEILIDSIPGATFHNGSRLLISKDNKIMMTTGDVRNPIISQDLSSVNGKILRINLDGSIPIDNPIPDSYIYSFGHRNCQGLTYGPNDQLYVSEHGELMSDEINMIMPNRNYGWPQVEGYCNTSIEINYCNDNNVVEPLIDWTPCVGVNGIEYYDHDAIPEWKGKMMMAVLGGAGFQREPRISILTFNEDGTEIIDEDIYFENFGRLRDLCVNPHNGAIYFATNGMFYPGFGPNQIVEYANLDFVDSVEDPEVTQTFDIVPNPGSDIITIHSTEGLMGAEFEIISFKGDIVRSGKLNDNRFELNISDLPVGNYFIKSGNKKGVVTRTFAIVR